MKTITLQIPDMQSAHCQLRVTKAVQTVAGAKIEQIAAGSATITLETQSQPEVVNAIEKAGYTVASVGESNEKDETFQFRTNINCGGCVARVSPALNEAPGICHWDVDTQSKDKVLTVHSEGISREEVMERVRKAGFTIESVQ